jgi:hypothetical protein
MCGPGDQAKTHRDSFIGHLLSYTLSEESSSAMKNGSKDAGRSIACSQVGMARCSIRFASFASCFK